MSNLEEKYVFDVKLAEDSVFLPPTELALRFRGEVGPEEKLWINPLRLDSHKNMRFVCKVPQELGALNFAHIALKGATNTTKITVEEVRTTRPCDVT